MAVTRRIKVSGRFYAMMLLLAAIIALAVFLPKRGERVMREADMEASFSPKAVIIRDESCVSVKKFDMVDYQVNEGAGVNAETPVAKVYKWGYTDDMTQALVSIQQKIYEKQLSILDGIESPELASANAGISELRKKIRECVADDSGEDLLALEQNMRELLSRRAEYLKSSVQPDVELDSLYAEEAAKQAQIAEYTSVVSAKMTGVVSFYFDGYEQVLNAAKLDIVNTDVLNKVLSGSSDVAAESGDSMLYRLVNPNRWYAAFVTPASEGLRLAEGQTYSVAFEGIYDRAYTGKALAPVVYDGGVMNMIEFSEDIGRLMDVRTADTKITAPMTGFSVEPEAVKVKDGECTITTDGGSIAVNVVASDGNKLLVTGQALYDGLKYKK